MANHSPAWIAFEYCQQNDSCTTYGEEERAGGRAPASSGALGAPMVY